MVNLCLKEKTKRFLLMATATVVVEEVEKVFFIYLNDTKENPEIRLTRSLMNDLADAFKKCEASGARCIVLTSNSKKFFSNGLDLSSGIPESSLLADLEVICSCFLSSGVPTIAAINGHAFGGGFMLSMACDWRLMNSSRGWVCIPAVDLNITLPPLLLTLLADRVGASSAARVVLAGHRHTAQEALSLGLLHQIASAESLEEATLALARKIARDPSKRSVYAATKKSVLRNTFTELAKNNIVAKL